MRSGMSAGVIDGCSRASLRTLLLTPPIVTPRLERSNRLLSRTQRIGKRFESATRCGRPHRGVPAMVDAAGTSRRSAGTDSSGHMAMLESGEQAASLRRLLDRESDTGDARTTPRYPPSGPSVGVDEGCVAPRCAHGPCCAELYESQGKHSEAEPLFKRSREILRNVLGPSIPALRQP